MMKVPDYAIIHARGGDRKTTIEEWKAFTIEARFKLIVQDRIEFYLDEERMPTLEALESIGQMDVPERRRVWVQAGNGLY